MSGPNWVAGGQVPLPYVGTITGLAEFTPTVDPLKSNAVTPGDATTLTGNAGNQNVTRVAIGGDPTNPTHNIIVTNPGPQGIVTQGAPRGGTATVGVAGTVGNAITGLGSGSAQRVIVNPITGRPMRMPLPRGGEAFLGNGDVNGNLTVAAVQHVGTAPVHAINITAAPYGAVPDFQVALQSSVTPGTVSHITGFSGGTFSAADIGKSCTVIAGGSGGSSDLHTTITGAGGQGSGSTNINGSDVQLADALVYGGLYNHLVIGWGTENSTAIQAAHDAAFANGGHTVHIPYGSYFFTTQLRCKETVNFVGDCIGGGVDKGTGSRLMFGGTGVAMLAQPSASNIGMTVHWSNFALQTFGQDAPIGIQIIDSYYSTFRGVQVWGSFTSSVIGDWGPGCYVSGWWLGGASVNTGFNLFHGCQGTNCRGNGLYLDQSQGSAYEIYWHGGGLNQNSWGAKSQYAQSSLSGGNVTFSGAAQTITRTSGNFFTDGYVNGTDITVSGTSSNNGTFTITGITATVLTVASGLVNEGPDGGVAIAGPVLQFTPPSVHFVGTDFEGNVLGGVTGTFWTLELQGCYQETPAANDGTVFGALIDISGSQHCYNVRVIDNYINGWGTRTSPIYLGSSSGIQSAVIEGNMSPQTMPDFAIGAARSLVSMAACKRVRIGANYSLLPVFDVGGTFGPTHDLGVDKCSIQLSATSIPTGDGHYTNHQMPLAWDPNGNLNTMRLSRPGGVLMFRHYLQTSDWSAGDYDIGVWVAQGTDDSFPFNTSCFKPSAMTGNAVSPIVVTTAAPHPAVTGGQVTIAAAAGNTAANGTWTVTRIDPTHFSLNGSTGNGAYTGSGDIQYEVRGADLSDPSTLGGEVYQQRAAGSGTYLVEEASLPAGTQVYVLLTTSNDFNPADGDVLSIEVVLGYLGLSASVDAFP